MKCEGHSDGFHCDRAGLTTHANLFIGRWNCYSTSCLRGNRNWRSLGCESTGRSVQLVARELRQAIEWSDFLIHGSGPSLVAANDVAAFAKHTGKPYGVYGITQSAPIADLHKQMLSEASFAFFRDSVSLNGFFLDFSGKGEVRFRSFDLGTGRWIFAGIRSCVQ